MGVTGIGGTARAAGPSATRTPPRGGGFRLPAATGPAEAAPMAAVAPVGLLAVQAADGAAERNRRGAARARGLLKELSALQAGLLRGEADAGGLARLAELAEGESPDDPALADALAGIALRARIELARRGIMVAGT
ncbi:flagellar assembly protein FliX [Roseomonas populi]|uniref:Flagellar assembly protein FliX n=1 Tax=Roseomonas populi TaxID=3121582 RepID=A0ABT1WZK9_9PROT|nr:flagellar assembly protein FliX [Roseomonas pecuniae]MCR0981281.1 flagellar assembly protein FliX [Roseomonas pecuniae]